MTIRKPHANAIIKAYDGKEYKFGFPLSDAAASEKDGNLIFKWSDGVRLTIEIEGNPLFETDGSVLDAKTLLAKFAETGSGNPDEGPEQAAQIDAKVTDRPSFRDEDGNVDLMGGIDHLNGLDLENEEEKPDPFAPYVYKQIIPDEILIGALGAGATKPYNGPEITISLAENGQGGVGATFQFSESSSYLFTYLVNDTRNSGKIRWGDRLVVEDLGLKGNPYGDPTYVRLEVQDVWGWQGLHVKVIEDTFQLPPVQVELTGQVISFGDGMAKLGFDLSWPAKDPGTLVVKTEYGEFTISLVRGESHYEIDAPLSDGTPYGKTIDVFTGTVTGGGFVLPVAPCELSVEHAGVPTGLNINIDDAGMVTFTLDHEPKENFTFTYTIDDEQYFGEIEAGQTIFAHPNPVSVPQNPYGEKVLVRVEVSETKGGGFGQMKPVEHAEREFIAPISRVTLAFIIIDVEGDTEIGTLELEYAPIAEGKITISDPAGKEITVDLIPGQKIYRVDLPHKPGTDPYAPETLEWEAVVKGGGYASEIDPVKATLELGAVASKATVELTQDGDKVVAIVKLDNKPLEEVKVKLEINGEEEEVVIPAGETSITIPVSELKPNPYGEEEHVKVEIREVTGGGLKEIESGASDEGDFKAESLTPHFTFELEHGWKDDTGKISLEYEPKDNGEITITAPDGKVYTVAVEPGQTEYITKMGLVEGSPYEAQTGTWTANITGDGYEKPFEPQTAQGPIDPVTTYYDVKYYQSEDLSTIEAVFTITQAPKDEDFRVTFRINGEMHTFTMPVGETTPQTITFPVQATPYSDNFILDVWRTEVTGGGFATQRPVGQINGKYLFPSPHVSPAVEMNITGEDEGYLHCKIKLDWEPKDEGRLVIAAPDSDEVYEVALIAGQKEYTLDIPKPAYEKTPYDEGQDFQWRVESVQGGAFLHTDGVASDYVKWHAHGEGAALATVELSQEGNEVFGAIQLDWEAHAPVEIKYAVKGIEYEAIIPVGGKSIDLGKILELEANPYGNKSPVDVQITEIRGGGFIAINGKGAEGEFVSPDIVTPVLTITITDIDGDVEKGRLELDWEPKEKGEITVKAPDGSEITVELVKGQKVYDIDLPHKSADSPYEDGENLTWEAYLTGGGFVNAPAPASSSLHLGGIESAVSVNFEQNGNTVSVSLELEHPAKTDADITCEINGKEYTAHVKAGENTASLGDVELTPNPYGDNETIKVEITGIKGGGFADLKGVEVQEEFTPSANKPVLTFTVTDIDGDIEKGALTLDYAPKADGTITVTGPDGKEIEVALVAGQKEYSVDLPHAPVSTPYNDGESFEWSASLTGGGFVHKPAPASASLSLDGIAITPEIRLVQNGKEISAVLTYPYEPKEDVTLTITVNGEDFTITTPAGVSEISLDDVFTLQDNPYGEKSRVDIKIKEIEGGNFANIQAGASDSGEFEGNVVIPTLNFEVDDVEGDTEIGHLKLDWEPKDSGTITITGPDGSKIGVDLVPGQKEYTVDLPHKAPDNPYESESLSWTAEVKGGGFVKDIEPATAGIELPHVPTTPKISLVQDGDSVDVKIELDKEPKSDVTVKVTVNGEEKELTIPAGEKEIVIKDAAEIEPNPWGEKTPVTVEIKKIEGGDFADIKEIEPVSDEFAPVTPITPQLNFEITDIPGDVERGKLTLDWEPKDKGEIEITAPDGSLIKVDLIAGQKEYIVSLSHKPAENPFVEGEDLEWTAQVTGGGFVNSPDPASASLHLLGAPATLALSVSESVNEGDAIIVTASLSHPGREDVVVRLVDGREIVIAKGEKTGTITAETREDDHQVQGDASAYFQIASVSGAEQFENLQVNYGQISSLIKDNDTETKLGLTVSENVVEGSPIILTASLNKESDQDLLVKINGEYEIRIAAGSLTGTAEIATRLDDHIAQGDEAHTFKITDVQGGDRFEKLVVDKTEHTATVIDNAVDPETGEPIFGENDSVKITLLAPVEVVEGETISLRVVLNKVNEKDLTIRLTDGREILVKAGEAEGKIEIATRPDDILVQGDQRLSFQIASVEGLDQFENALVDMSQIVTTTIRDNESPVHLELAVSDSVAEGQPVIVIAKLDHVSKDDVTVTVNGNMEITIKAGTLFGAAEVPTRDNDNLIQGDETLAFRITDVSGGNFENLIVEEKEYHTIVTDMSIDPETGEPAPGETDTTTITLSAPAEVFEDEDIEITATLSNPAGDEPVVITLTDGKEIVIAAHEKSGSITLSSRPDDYLVQGDEIVNFQIASVSGLTQFENAEIDYSAVVSTTIKDNKSPSHISLSVSPSVQEGNPIVLTASLDHVSDEDVTVMVNGDIEILIAAGSLSGTATVSTRPDDHIIQGNEELSFVITSIEGKERFEKIIWDETEHKTIVTDTAIDENGDSENSETDKVNIALSAPEEVIEGEKIVVKAVLDKEASEDLTVRLTDGCEITILAGQKEGSIEIETRENDALTQGEETITFQIDSVDGLAQFESANVDYGQILSTIVKDDATPTHLTLSVTESVVEGCAANINVTDAGSVGCLSLNSNSLANSFAYVHLNEVNALDYIDAQNLTSAIHVYLEICFTVKSYDSELKVSETSTEQANGTSVTTKVYDLSSLPGLSSATLEVVGGDLPKDFELRFDGYQWQAGDGWTSYGIYMMAEGTELGIMSHSSLIAMRFSLRDDAGNPVNLHDFNNLNSDVAGFHLDTRFNSVSLARNTIGINADTPDYTASYNDDSQTVTVNLRNGGKAVLELDKPLTEGDEISFDITFAGEIDDMTGDGEPIVITAALDHVSDEDLTVKVNDDLEITIKAGELTGFIELATRPDDHIKQGDETRIFKITGVEGGERFEKLIIDESEHTATITDSKIDPETGKPIYSDTDSVTLALEAPETVYEGEAIVLKAVLDKAALNDVTVTLTNGQEIIIAKGEIEGQIELDSRPDDYLRQGDQEVVFQIESVTGIEKFENTNIAYDQPVSTIIKDNESETRIVLSSNAQTSDAYPFYIPEGEQIILTATVNHIAEHDMIVTVQDQNGELGTEHEILIKAGESAGSITIDTRSNDHLSQGADRHVFEVIGVDCDLESLSSESCYLDVTDTAYEFDFNLLREKPVYRAEDTTKLMIYAPTEVVEGEKVVIRAQLDKAADKDFELKFGGQVITIAAGDLEGVVEFDLRPDNYLKDNKTVSGFNFYPDPSIFENLELYVNDEQTSWTSLYYIIVTDNQSESHVALSLPEFVKEGDSFEIKALLDHASDKDVVVYLNDGSNIYNGTQIRIKAGELEGSVVMETRPDDYIAQGDVKKYYKIAAVSDSSRFEKLVIDSAYHTVTIMDTDIDPETGEPVYSDTDTLNLSISAPETVAEGEKITITASIDKPHEAAIRIIFKNGRVLTIDALKTTGKIELDAREDDFYAQGDQNIMFEIESVVSTYKIENLVINNKSFTVTVKDDADATSAAIDIPREGSSADVVITLSNTPFEPASVKYMLNGVEYVKELAAGEKSFTADRIEIDENPYGEKTSVNVEVLEIKGGGYEATIAGQKAESVFGSSLKPVITFEVHDVEGDREHGILTLDWEPKEAGTIRITDSEGDWFEVDLFYGQKVYELDLVHGQITNPYIEGEDYSWTATIIGGGFANLPDPATSSLHFDGIETTPEIELVRDGDSVSAIFSVDNPPRTDLEITYKVNGVQHTCIIPAGGTTITVEGIATIQANPYGQESVISVEVQYMNGGEYAFLKVAEKAELAFEPQESVLQKLSFTVEDMPGSTEKGHLSLDWEPLDHGYIEIECDNGWNVTVELVAGQTVYEVDLPRNTIDDPVVVGETFTWTAHTIGGGFAQNSEPVSASLYQLGITPIVSVDLDRSGDDIELTFSVDYTPTESINIKYTINGEEFETIIPPNFENSSASHSGIILPNPYGDVVYVEVKIIEVSGGGFARISAGEPVSDSYDAWTYPVITFTGEDVDGDIEQGLVSIDFEPRETGTLIIHNPDSAIDDVIIDLVVGQREYAVNLPHTPSLNPYDDGDEFTWSATIEGGGFMYEPAPAWLALNVAGREITPDILLEVDGHDALVTLDFTYPSKTDAEIRYSINGIEGTALLKADQRDVTLDPVALDAKETEIEVKVLEVIGGGYAKVLPAEKSETLTLPAPEIDFENGQEFSVYESGLNTDQEQQEGPMLGSSSFRINTFGQGGTLYINGTAYEVDRNDSGFTAETEWVEAGNVFINLGYIHDGIVYFDYQVRKGGENVNGADLVREFEIELVTDGGSASGSISIAVIDGGPIARGIEAEVQENAEIYTGELVWDEPGQDGWRMDGDRIDAFRLVSAPSGVYGTILLNGDGIYTYTRNSEKVAFGEEAKDVFEYKVYDSDGSSKSGFITISVIDTPPAQKAGLNLVELLDSDTLNGTANAAASAHVFDMTQALVDAEFSSDVSGITGVEGYEWTASGKTLIGTKDGHEIRLEITGFNADGTVQLAASMNGAFHHESVSDTDIAGIKLVGTDAGGSKGESSNVWIRLVDDAPSYTGESNVYTYEEGVTHSIFDVINPGADKAAAKIEWGNPETEYGRFEFDGFEWKFVANEKINEIEFGQTERQTLEYVYTDGDGDTITGSVHVDIAGLISAVANVEAVMSDNKWLTVTISLDQIAQSDAELTYTIEGKTYTGTIKAGESSFIAEPIEISPYGANKYETVELTKVEGGGFASVELDSTDFEKPVTNIGIGINYRKTGSTNFDIIFDLGYEAKQDLKIDYTLNGNTFHAVLEKGQSSVICPIKINVSTTDMKTEDMSVGIKWISDGLANVEYHEEQKVFFIVDEKNLSNGSSGGYSTYLKHLTQTNEISLEDASKVLVEGHEIPLDGSSYVFYPIKDERGEIAQVTCKVNNEKLITEVKLLTNYLHENGNESYAAFTYDMEIEIENPDSTVIKNYAIVIVDDNGFGGGTSSRADTSYDQSISTYAGAIIGADGIKNRYLSGFEEADSESGSFKTLFGAVELATKKLNSGKLEYGVKLDVDDRSPILFNKLVSETFGMNVIDEDGSFISKKFSCNWRGLGSRDVSGLSGIVVNDGEFKTGDVYNYVWNGKFINRGLISTQNMSFTVDDVDNIVINGVEISAASLNNSSFNIDLDNYGNTVEVNVLKNFYSKGGEKIYYFDLIIKGTSISYHENDIYCGKIDIEFVMKNGKHERFEKDITVLDNIPSLGSVNIDYSFYDSSVTLNPDTSKYGLTDLSGALKNYVIWEDAPTNGSRYGYEYYSHGLGTMEIRASDYSISYIFSQALRMQYAYGEMIRDEFYFTITDNDGTEVRSSMVFIAFGLNKDLAPREKAVMLFDPSTHVNMPQSEGEYIIQHKTETAHFESVTGEEQEFLIAMGGVSSLVSKTLASASVGDTEIAMDGTETELTLQYGENAMDATFRYDEEGVHVTLKPHDEFTFTENVELASDRIEIVFTNEAGQSCSRFLKWEVENPDFTPMGDEAQLEANPFALIPDTDDDLDDEISVDFDKLKELAPQKTLDMPEDLSDRLLVADNELDSLDIQSCLDSINKFSITNEIDEKLFPVPEGKTEDNPLAALEAVNIEGEAMIPINDFETEKALNEVSVA